MAEGWGGPPARPFRQPSPGTRRRRAARWGQSPLTAQRRDSRLSQQTTVKSPKALVRPGNLDQLASTHDHRAEGTATKRRLGARRAARVSMARCGPKRVSGLPCIDQSAICIRNSRFRLPVPGGRHPQRRPLTPLPSVDFQEFKVMAGRRRLVAERGRAESRDLPRCAAASKARGHITGVGD